MTPEAKRFLAAARRHLDYAVANAGLGLSEIAGREAYLAAFHAAHAILFERTGRTVKTHRGLRSAFSLLAHQDDSIKPDLITFLSNAYEMKSVADYGTEPETGTSESEAAEAIETARHFVETIAAILGPEDPTTP